MLRNKAQCILGFSVFIVGTISDYSQSSFCFLLNKYDYTNYFCRGNFRNSRPEAIKLAPVIKQLNSVVQIKTHLILTGQHREMVDRVMELFDLSADHDLAIMKPKQTLTSITCDSLLGLEKIFATVQPKLIFVQGDTTTAFSAALAAFYHQIPVGHVEAWFAD